MDTVEVISVVGGGANLPCDLTPPFPSDEPHLILFYKDVYGTPIYRLEFSEHIYTHSGVNCAILSKFKFAPSLKGLDF